MLRRLFLVFILTAGVAVRAAVPAAPPDLDAWVARAMQTFDVPGVALAVVKDDAVVVARGYGVRRMGEPARVDEKTLFGIASNTKAFTATALGLLVEEHKIDWDAPVIRYLPAFAMWDPYVTRELTVRDLLVHRSGLGLGAGDLLWWPESTYNRKDIAYRLRFIPPATSFRSAYAYDNVTVPGRWRSHRGRQRTIVGRFRHQSNPQARRDDGQQRPALVFGSRCQRCRHARAYRRQGPADPSIRERQYKPRGWHQLVG